MYLTQRYAPQSEKFGGPAWITIGRDSSLQAAQKDVQRMLERPGGHTESQLRIVEEK